MTSTVRGIPSLTLAPTQNTAPVFEFRCLYTPDVRKKKKVWHDGSLRFHTFNRRVMVYDDSKNYIGDAHWRETGDLKDGEEIKLDKGVMVEVGEQIGRTETDLAPIILEKRRPETASSPTRIPPQSNTLSVGPRPAGCITQARPKSLAAVIGASQGTIGRARLPTRSPFEQRQDNIRQQPAMYGERPEKRPKTVLEKENVAHYPISLQQNQLLTPQVLGSVTLKTNEPSQGQRMFSGPSRTLKSSAVLSIQTSYAPEQGDRHEEDRCEHLTIPVARSRQLASTSLSTSMARSTREPARSRISTTTSPNHNIRQKVPADLPTVQVGKINHAKVTADRSSAKSGSYEVTVMNKLRFMKEKPRRKLIYSDLIPRARQRKSGSTCINGDARKRQQREQGRAPDDQRNTESLPQEGKIINLLSQDDEDAPLTVQTHVRRDLGTYQKSVSQSSNASTSSSPLFVNQSPHSPGLTMFQQSLDQDFVPPVTPKLTHHEGIASEGTEILAKFPKDPPENVIGPDLALAANLEGTRATGDFQAPSNPSLPNQRLLQTAAAATGRPHDRSLFGQSLKQRPFRRILSEGDSYVNGPTEDLLTTNPGTIDSMATCKRQGHEQPRKSFRCPATVQRSISDMTHLVQGVEAPEGRAPIITVDEAGFDPWSEYEAYLLFDWWPPGKEKPSFARTDS